MKNWDNYFIELAHLVATRSKDRSVQVGAVIVDKVKNIRACGYNGFVRNINDDIEARHQRPTKYLWTEHAERNAIYSAARSGISVEGCSIYCTHAPCCDCVRGIIQSGITTVYYPIGTIMATFAENIMVGQEMLNEAGVVFAEINGTDTRNQKLLEIVGG
jgi:dCMP deaminase